MRDVLGQRHSSQSIRIRTRNASIRPRGFDSRGEDGPGHYRIDPDAVGPELPRHSARRGLEAHVWYQGAAFHGPTTHNREP